MSSLPSPDASEPEVYHPQFSPTTAIRDPLIIEAEDKVLFYVSLDLVKSLTSFRPDIPIGHNADKRWSWHRADPDSLALVLLTLTDPDRLINLTRDIPTFLMGFPKAAIVMQVYRIPRFQAAFTELISSLGPTPAESFTLAALTHDARSLDEFRRAVLVDTVPLLPSQTQDNTGSHAPKSTLSALPFTHSLIELLTTSAPHALAELQKRHKLFSRLFNGFAYDLAGVNIRLDGFGEKCRKRFGRGCPGYLSTVGRMPHLRYRAAVVATRFIVLNDLKAMCGRIEDVLHDEVRCETCTHRLINAYDGVMRRVFFGM